jgi:hypothetical protein
MKLKMKSAVAGVAALALAGVGVVATAGSAAAYPTTTPAWVAGDTARNGEIFIYDTTGAQITGGSDYNVIGQFFAGQTTAKTTGATLAGLNIAFPDATNAVPSTWFSTILQGSTAFSTAANRPTAVGPVINKNAWPTGSTPIADTLSGGTLSSATNYQNVFELRMANSGPGGVNGAGKYWAVDIEFNPAAAGGATFDGLAPQAWRVLQATTATATTTTVTAPASATTAAPGTYSATVSPSGAPGTVQFTVDGVNFGSPVTVSAGAASIAGSAALSAGSHSLGAVFTAVNPAYTVGYGNSTATPAPFTVTQVTVGTTTNLSLSTASVTQGTGVDGTAVVTNPSTITAGSVSFTLDGAASPFATDTNGADGFTFTGLSTSSLTPGSHSVVANYLGSTGNNASASSAASFTVTAPAYANDPQNIQTSITAGTLVISTSYTSSSPLVLPAMTLNSTATEYATSAAFTGISVADTRPGNLAYTLSAISTNLTKNGVAIPGANETINAQNVGLNISSLTSTNATPNTFLGAQTPGTATTGQNFTGFNNAAAAHLAASATGSAGLGGSSPHVVLHANSGLGTTVTAGTLSITAPSNTLDGTYAGVITFSIIGS